MDSYILLLLSLICFSMLEFFTKKKLFFIIAVLELIFFAGLRYEIGYDYKTYGKFFNQIDSLSDVFFKDIDAEKGYLLLNYFVKQLGFDFSVFLLFFSIISLSLLGLFLYKHTAFPTAVLVYYCSRFYFVRDMGQIRSSLVAIIFLYTIPYIKQKKLGIVVALSLLGACFHIVALFIIPAYFFVWWIKKVTLQKMFLLIGFSILIGTVFFFPSLFSWIVPARYLGYITGKYLEGRWLLNPIFILQFLLLLGSLLCIKEKKERYNESINLIISLYLLSTLCLVIFGPLATIAGRISTIFATVEIILVPELFRNIFKNNYLNLMLFYSFCICVFILIFFVSNAYGSYIPYQTVFTIN